LLTFFGISPTRTPSASATYEQAIVRFKNGLAGGKPPGFIAATSFQIEDVSGLR
jgi:hypothetical protein